MSTSLEQTDLLAFVLIDLPNVSDDKDRLSLARLKLILQGCRQIAKKRSTRTARKLVFLDIKHYLPILDELSTLCYEEGYLIVHCLRLQNPPKETVDGRILEYMLSQSWCSTTPILFLLHSVDRDYPLVFPGIQDLGENRVEIINPPEFPTGSRAGRNANAQHWLGLLPEGIAIGLRTHLHEFIEKNLGIIRQNFTPFNNTAFQESDYKTSQLLVLIVTYLLQNDAQETYPFVRVSDITTFLSTEAPSYGIQDVRQNYIVWILHQAIDSQICLGRQNGDSYISSIKLNATNQLVELVRGVWIPTMSAFLAQANDLPTVVPENNQERHEALTRVLSTYLNPLGSMDSRRLSAQIISHLGSTFSLETQDAKELFDEASSSKGNQTPIIKRSPGNRFWILFTA